MNSRLAPDILTKMNKYEFYVVLDGEASVAKVKAVKEKKKNNLLEKEQVEVAVVEVAEKLHNNFGYNYHENKNT